MSRVRGRGLQQLLPLIPLTNSQRALENIVVFSSEEVAAPFFDWIAFQWPTFGRLFVLPGQATRHSWMGHWSVEVPSLPSSVCGCPTSVHCRVLS